MVLSQDPPFLFIHIPKTAGSSVEEALFHYQSFDYFTIQHGCALQYKDWLDDDFYFSLFKFAFVRNPWDLQVSTYRYYVLGMGIDMTFKEYVKWKFEGSIQHMVDRLPKDNPNAKIDWLQQSFYIHRGPQTYFLIDEKGKFLVDYIGSFERFDEHFGNISKKLKLENYFVPHVNSSSSYATSSNYRDYYDKETEEIVRSRYALDIKMFGYDFQKGFANKEIMGIIDKTNDTVEKRGYKIPVDFYFSFASLPYGMSNIQARYDNQEETEVERIKYEFERNKIERRISSLRHNIQKIEHNIELMKEEILNTPDDFVKFNQFKLEMSTQMEKALIFSMEAKRQEQKLDFYQTELTTKHS